MLPKCHNEDGVSSTVPAARFDDTPSQEQAGVLLSSRFLSDDPSGQPVRGAETIFETSIDSSLSRTGSDDQAWSSTMRPTILSILRSASRSSFDGI
jgi:hypothetical protein